MQFKKLSSSILLFAIFIQCLQSISSKLFSNFFNNQIHAKPSTIKEYSIYSLQSNPNNNNFPDGDDNNNNWNNQNDFQTRLVDQERDQLYEAYNLLHTLAQVTPRSLLILIVMIIFNILYNRISINLLILLL